MEIAGPVATPLKGKVGGGFAVYMAFDEQPGQFMCRLCKDRTVFPHLHDQQHEALTRAWKRLVGTLETVLRRSCTASTSSGSLS